MGVAILIFTLIVKLALLPFSIKQQKDSAKTAIFQPKMMEIQQKYANNREKQSEEILKLQQQGYKPMSGCGTILLSFLILFGVIDVVYKPLTHIVHMNKEKIIEMAQEAYGVEVTAFFAEEAVLTDDEVNALPVAAQERHKEIMTDAEIIIDYYNQHCLSDGKEAVDVSVLKSLDTGSVKIITNTFKKAVAEAYNTDPSEKKKKAKTIADTDMYRITDEETEALKGIADENENNAYRSAHSFSKYTTDMLSNANASYGTYSASSTNGSVFMATSSMQRELYSLECFGTVTDNFTYKNAFREIVIRPELRAELEELHSNMNFVGIPLGQVPKNHMGFPMILVPILSFVMSLLQTIISNRIMTKNSPETASAMGPMKITMYIMPFMSLWIAFTLPAGAGFYWTISYAIGILQSVLLNFFFNPNKLKAQAQAEIDAKSKQIAARTGKTPNITAEESRKQKEINRRKLAQARREDAEKYGEEYNEDEDDED